MKFEDWIKKKEELIKEELRKNPRTTWAKLVSTIDKPEYSEGQRVLFYMGEESHVQAKEIPRIGTIKKYRGRNGRHREVYDIELEDNQMLISHPIYIIEVLDEKTTD